MRFMQNAILVVSFLAFAAMLNYETVAKSPQIFGSPLPGWVQARLIDRQVSFRHATRIVIVDRLLHETEEAVAFYRRLVS